jgi:cytochrome c2
LPGETAAWFQYDEILELWNEVMIANRDAGSGEIENATGRPGRWGYLLFVLMLALGSSGLAQSPASGGLSEAELDGKGMFQQRCSVCHLPHVIDNDGTWGPKLSAPTVTGKEAVVREFIRRGTPRMPGFQYGLTAAEIDNIIAYLKTVK